MVAAAAGSWMIGKSHLMPRPINTLDGFNPMFVHALAGAVLGDLSLRCNWSSSPTPRASAIVLGVMLAYPARRV